VWTCVCAATGWTAAANPGASVVMTKIIRPRRAVRRQESPGGVRGNARAAYSP
jgi:hypothetical protein